MNMRNICWEDYGSPKIENASVHNAANLIAEVYKYTSTGGNLHIQIDDWNIEDEYWEKYENWLEGIGYTDIHEQVNAEKACFDAMKILSLEERASALALHDGFWEPEYALYAGVVVREKDVVRYDFGGNDDKRPSHQMD